MYQALFFPSRAKEAKKKNKEITPDLRLTRHKPILLEGSRKKRVYLYVEGSMSRVAGNNLFYFFEKWKTNGKQIRRI